MLTMVGLDEEFNSLIKLHRKGDLSNFIIAGDKGAGKTEFCRELAERINKKLIIENCINLNNENDLNAFFESISDSNNIVLLDNLDYIIEFDKKNLFLLKSKIKEYSDKILFIAELRNTNVIENNIEYLKESFENIISLFYLNFDSRVKVWRYYLDKEKIEISDKDLSDLVNSIYFFNVNHVIKAVNNFYKYSRENKNTKNTLLELYIQESEIKDLTLDMSDNKEEILNVARHEIAHVFGAILNDLELFYVSIIPQIFSSGHCSALFDVNSNIDAKKHINYLLGGVVSEEKFYKNISIGASADLDDIDKIFDVMLTNGFSESFGTMKMNKDELSDAQKDYFLKEKRAIINDEKIKLSNFIDENIDEYNKTVKKLIKEKVLTYNDLNKIRKKIKEKSKKETHDYLYSEYNELKSKWYKKETYGYS